MNNVIEIKNLVKEYNGFKLKNVSLSIPEGSIVGLVGQNGAGKTTLIKLILEIINKDSGSINLFNGKTIKVAKDDIGVVLDQAFFPELIKVNDIDSIMRSIYKNWDTTLFKNYLNKFNLNNKLIKELSTGMRKKLEIATALAHKPKLLILDEPTSGLDPIVRNEILDIFLEFVENPENSILFSSHITTDLENIADYIVFIDNGSIVFNETIDDLKDNYAIVKCSDKDFEKLSINDYVNYKKSKYSYDVLVSNKKEIKKKYKDLVIDSASIENIMLLFLKGEK